MESKPKKRLAPKHPTLSNPFLEGIKHFDPNQWSRLVDSFGPIVYR